MTTKRILLIDDEADLREVALLSLEMVGGWQVIEGRSGSEGLAKAETEQPDAILLDLMMPGMDGFTTFERLQANNATKQIPVIFLTAKVNSDDRFQFDQLGISGVIAKPFDPMSLAQQVAETLGWI